MDQWRKFIRKVSPFNPRPAGGGLTGHEVDSRSWRSRPLAAATLTAASQGSAVPAKPDDKTILHVLNRIGFGARPGDVERVRQIGLAAYIEQQLHPDRMADAQVAARLAGLETLDQELAPARRGLLRAGALGASSRRRQAAGADPAMAEAPPDGTPGADGARAQSARQSCSSCRSRRFFGRRTASGSSKK